MSQRSAGLCTHCTRSNAFPGMAFSKSQMPKNLVKLRVEDKWFDEFLAWVIWKNPYSHFRYHSIHIVENYKTELSLYKVLVKVMFTLYKMAIKTLVHTLQRFDDFFFTKKKSSNHFKVLTWVFLATLYDKSFNVQRKSFYIFATIVVFYNDFGCLLQQKSITKTK